MIFIEKLYWSSEINKCLIQLFVKVEQVVCLSTLGISTKALIHFYQHLRIASSMLFDVIMEFSSLFLTPFLPTTQHRKVSNFSFSLPFRLMLLQMNHAHLITCMMLNYFCPLWKMHYWKVQIQFLNEIHYQSCIYL